MRSEQEILSIILNTAKEDERVRAVLLSGSRTNRKVKKDRLQDFDVVFIVTELQSFEQDHNWIDIFGERIIIQMPDTMVIDNDPDPDPDSQNNRSTFTYLMLFKDKNRIDLTLCLVEAKHLCEDSLNIVLIDKDDLYPKNTVPNDRDYLIRRPSEKYFLDCCNEFWWVSTYVMKGLCRKEIIYAKDMLENPVRNMFVKMIEWYVGTETNFSVNIGKSGKFLKEHVDSKMWNRIINTYPNAEIISIWQCLEQMMILFGELAIEVANKLNFKYDANQEENVFNYFHDMKSMEID